jgi:hypothetical protein
VAEGGYVFITGRRQSELDKAVATICHQVTAVQGDLADQTAVEALAREGCARRGCRPSGPRGMGVAVCRGDTVALEATTGIEPV